MTAQGYTRNDGGMPPPPPFPPHQPPQPPQSQQPRWAWWVVGIAIPVLGILATLLTVVLKDDDSSDDGRAAGTVSSPSAQENAPADSGTPAGDAGDAGEKAQSPAAVPSAPSVRYGPADLVVEASASGGSVDVDSEPPLVTVEHTDGSDLYFDVTGGEPVDAEGQVAPLPPGADDPTEADCATRIEKNAVHEVELSRDVRFCVLTDEGRTAYLRVLSAPATGEGTVRLKATVWDLPE